MRIQIDFPECAMALCHAAAKRLRISRAESIHRATSAALTSCEEAPYRSIIDHAAFSLSAGYGENGSKISTPNVFEMAMAKSGGAIGN